jgi:hypothetical protein
MNDNNWLGVLFKFGFFLGRLFQEKGLKIIACQFENDMPIRIGTHSVFAIVLHAHSHCFYSYLLFSMVQKIDFASVPTTA